MNTRPNESKKSCIFVVFFKKYDFLRIILNAF